MARAHRRALGPERFLWTVHIVHNVHNLFFGNKLFRKRARAKRARETFRKLFHAKNPAPAFVDHPFCPHSILAIFRETIRIMFHGC